MYISHTAILILISIAVHGQSRQIKILQCHVFLTFKGTVRAKKIIYFYWPSWKEIKNNKQSKKPHLEIFSGCGVRAFQRLQQCDVTCAKTMTSKNNRSQYNVFHIIWRYVLAQVTSHCCNLWKAPTPQPENISRRVFLLRLLFFISFQDGQ